MYNFITTTNTVFLSILLQAIPFMLLGIIISSILHVFVSDRFIVKIFPNKHGVGFFTAIFSGLFFPVCECATVPIISGLIKKGVSMPVAITFMLAAPIVNPISIMATIYAFPENPMIAVYRVLFGIIIALSIGILLLFYPKTKYLKDETEPDSKFCPCCHCHTHDSQKNKMTLVKRRKFFFVSDRVKKTVRTIFLHSGTEFFNVGSYLILGAGIAAIIRVGVPSNFFAGFSIKHSYGGIIIMMLFAFIFSACSTSDAFIGRSFYGTFTLPSIMGFLVYGPMMDIKNIFMLLSVFKKQFVIELTILITVINLIFISAFSFIFL